MGENTSKKRTSKMVLMLIMFAVFFASIAGYGYFGVEEVDSYSLFNVGYNLIAMFVSLILYFCSVVDGMDDGPARRTFSILLSCTMLAMASDSITYFLEGKAWLRYYHIVIMALVYVLDYLIYYLFFLYLSTVLDIRKDPAIRRILKGIWFVTVLCMASAVMNIFIPLYYYVDENGAYSRVFLYPLNSLFKIVVMLILFGVLLAYRKKLKVSQIRPVAFYTLVTVIMITYDHFAGGIYVEYAVILLLLLIIYVVLNVESGIKGAGVKKEFDTAKNIQASLLPNLFPDYVDVPEFDIYAEMIPAREVGGDFYDFFMLDEKRFAFLVGDVSVHSVGGALFMAVTKSMINMGSQLGGTPGEILSNVNQRILDSKLTDMKARVWLGFLEIDTGRLVYANAGGCVQALLIHEVSDRFRLMGFSDSPMIGEKEEYIYENSEIILKPLDRIFLYTEGIASTQRRDGTTFGDEGLLSALNENLRDKNEALCDEVKKAIGEFLGDEQQGNDITMLGFTYKGAEGVKAS